MIKYAFFRSDEDTSTLSLFGSFCYYGTNIFAVPIAFSLIFLTFNLFLQMYNNITSLERLSFKQFKLPCYGPVKLMEGYPVT